MEETLKEILSELKEIKTELSSMKTEQSQIKQAVFETNDSVKRLEGIQESQNRIIELLSARSIQHEAELKRIK